MNKQPWRLAHIHPSHSGSFKLKSIVAHLPLPWVIAIIAIVFSVAIGFFIKKIAEKEPSDVRVIWYLFFLSLVVTLIAAFWGAEVGAIDEKGNFHGRGGDVLDAVMKFMLNVRDDIALPSAILALVLLPQFGSYVLSGLAGCASAPILVGRSFSVFIWSLAKSFISASGVLMGISMFGGCKGWPGLDLRGVVSANIAALSLLLGAVYLISMYREMTHMAKSGTHPPKPGASRFSAWMSRNVRRHA